MKNKIPFNRPFIVGKEQHYISEAVISHSQLSGNGYFTQKCQAWIEGRFSALKAMLTHSCTAALEMAAILCDIKPGDEVIMPSYTFVSTANAFVLRGGVPVFIDIKKSNLNIDENLIEAAITPKTKAIVPVHYAGISCNMNTISDIARQYRLMIVEDAAQGFGATYNGTALGAMGDLGCYSFHETKNIISGEGGALLVNNPELVERADIIWEKGTNRKQFIEGQVDKYSWVDVGSSFLPNEQTAAFLYAQLERSDHINKNRVISFNKYIKGFEGLAAREVITIPTVNRQEQHNGHMFYILARSASERSSLIHFLQENNINAIFHYIPLHSSPAGKKFGKVSCSMKNTNDLSRRIVRLPLYYGMEDSEIDIIIETVKKYYEKK